MKKGDIVIKGQRVMVASYRLTSVIRFTGNGPIPDKYFCGEEMNWEPNV